MYSQNQEEIHILNSLADISNGRFLDIGAYDAKDLSNTRALFEKGWGGVLVEPGEPQLKGLHAEYDEHENISICERAVSAVDGPIRFYTTDYCTTLYTTDQSHMDKWDIAKFDETTVESISPKSLFERYGYDFDFISLDVEGGNWDMLQLLPFDKLTNLKCICVEYDSFYRECIDLLRSNGFIQVYRSGENIVAMKS